MRRFLLSCCLPCPEEARMPRYRFSCSAIHSSSMQCKGGEEEKEGKGEKGRERERRKRREKEGRAEGRREELLVDCKGMVALLQPRPRGLSLLQNATACFSMYLSTERDCSRCVQASALISMSRLTLLNGSKHSANVSAGNRHSASFISALSHSSR